MPESIVIRHFGPIEDVTLTLDKRIVVLIGQQSSGKSTIAKVIFFFKTVIKEQVWKALYDRTPGEMPQKTQTALTNGILHQVSAHFGNLDQEGLELKFTYSSGYSLHLYLEEGGKIRLDDKDFKYTGFYEALKAYDALALWQQEHPHGAKQYSVAEKVEVVQKEKALSRAVQDIFGTDEKAPYYIPAGRLLLSTVQQPVRDMALQEAKGALSQTDPYTSRFVDLANGIRKLLFSTTTEAVFRQQIDIQDGTDRSHLTSAYETLKPLMANILKGEYQVGTDGERLVINGGSKRKRSVLLNHASSGQQESLFVLLTLFYLLYDADNSSFMVIEEPEAHLFPKAQRYMVEAIAAIINAVKGSAIITTHSPYILAAFNNLVYAAQTGKIKPEQTAKLIPKPCWINPEQFVAFLVKDGKLETIVDQETQLASYRELDEVSDQLNDLFEQLFELEDE